ncbi:MAG: hypothetical protein MUD12_05085 [Spirochaetes bacterium]|nr:hypothetical protein [Spirochaetota bacterium]
MKKTIFIILISAAFLASCEKEKKQNLVWGYKNPGAYPDTSITDPVEQLLPEHQLFSALAINVNKGYAFGGVGGGQTCGPAIICNTAYFVGFAGMDQYQAAAVNNRTSGGANNFSAIIFRRVTIDTNFFIKVVYNGVGYTAVIPAADLSITYNAGNQVYDIVYTGAGIAVGPYTLNGGDNIHAPGF